MANNDNKRKLNNDEKGYVIVHEQPFCGFISDIDKDDEDDAINDEENTEDTTVTTVDKEVSDLLDNSLISDQSKDAPTLNYDNDTSSHLEILRWLDQRMTEFAQHQEVQEYTYSNNVGTHPEHWLADSGTTCHITNSD